MLNNIDFLDQMIGENNLSQIKQKFQTDEKKEFLTELTAFCAASEFIHSNKKEKIEEYALKASTIASFSNKTKLEKKFFQRIDYYLTKSNEIGEIKYDVGLFYKRLNPESNLDSTNDVLIKANNKWIKFNEINKLLESYSKLESYPNNHNNEHFNSIKYIKTCFYKKDFIDVLNKPEVKQPQKNTNLKQCIEKIMKEDMHTDIVLPEEKTTKRTKSKLNKKFPSSVSVNSMNSEYSIDTIDNINEMEMIELRYEILVALIKHLIDFDEQIKNSNDLSAYDYDLSAYDYKLKLILESTLDCLSELISKQYKSKGFKDISKFIKKICVKAREINFGDELLLIISIRNTIINYINDKLIDELKDILYHEIKLKFFKLKPGMSSKEVKGLVYSINSFQDITTEFLEALAFIHIVKNKNSKLPWKLFEKGVKIQAPKMDTNLNSEQCDLIRDLKIKSDALENVIRQEANLFNQDFQPLSLDSSFVTLNSEESFEHFEHVVHDNTDETKMNTNFIVKRQINNGNPSYTTTVLSSVLVKPKQHRDTSVNSSSESNKIHRLSLIPEHENNHESNKKNIRRNFSCIELGSNSNYIIDQKIDQKIDTCSNNTSSNNTSKEDVYAATSVINISDNQDIKKSKHFLWFSVSVGLISVLCLGLYITTLFTDFSNFKKMKPITNIISTHRYHVIAPIAVASFIFVSIAFICVAFANYAQSSELNISKKQVPDQPLTKIDIQNQNQNQKNNQCKG